MIDPRITDILTRVKAAQIGTAPTTTAAPEAALVIAITAALPAVISAIRPIIAQRRVTIATATTAITAISAAVARVAPQIKGGDARALVIGLFGWAWDTYLTQLLPVYLRPFAPAIRAAAVTGLQTAYDAVVKQTKR